MLTFKTEEFLNLKFLIIECSEISSINFDNGASPKLKKIVWSSTEKQSLFGIKYLPGLVVLSFYCQLSEPLILSGGSILPTI